MSTLSLGTIQSNTASPPTIANSGGTEIGTFCRAWVNFNGTGTVAIRGSFNVTSITDNGVGVYAINFTTALPDGNYAVSGMAKKVDTFTDAFISMGGTNQANPSTTSCPILTFGSSTPQDQLFVCAAIFR